MQDLLLNLGKATNLTISSKSYNVFEKINFSIVQKTTNSFADHLEKNIEEIAKVLLEYESYEVVVDEIGRTLDLLRNIKENKKFFAIRVGSVTSFLPRNQPLYSLTCFVLVPSLMASDVHFRGPAAMSFFYNRFIKILRINHYFPNVFISPKQRSEFMIERTALLKDKYSSQTIPVSTVVIFTGTSSHAEKLRLMFDNRTLVIANGAGHNPVVVTETADITNSVEAVLKLQLYNQGQDCAAPNAILVHESVFQSFIALLRSELSKIHVGHYINRFNTVGPISDLNDLVRIQELFVTHSKWLDISTPGIIKTAESIVLPTIIIKPLNEGGNYTELFAPIFFVQVYKSDEKLSNYFENPKYSTNAMYITYYGSSNYLNSLIGRKILGNVLHDSRSILANTHLHAKGIERGTQPYGGMGYAASSLSIDGKLICKATLPQRDIFEYVMKPLLLQNDLDIIAELRSTGQIIERKNIIKLLSNNTKPKEQENSHVHSSATHFYVDSEVLQKSPNRFKCISIEETFTLLSSKNIIYIASMNPEQIMQVRKLENYFKDNPNIEFLGLKSVLYSIPKISILSIEENKVRQKMFFCDLYQLLFSKINGPNLSRFLLELDRSVLLNLISI